MKKLIKITAVVLITLLNYTCSSDSNDSAACTPIPCLNGGTSNANCGCDCPQGFTGANCGTLITPTSVKITKIKVKKFPDVKTNGNWWDILPNSDADIYLTVENSAFTVIYNHPTYFTNATGLGTSTYDFIPATPINLTNVSSAYIINLYDYDGSTNNANNDFITLLAFIPFSTSQTSFPTTKIVTNGSAGTFECELTLQYTW